ncbi:hypothetical protein [Ruegeria sp. R14_0]|uniref:hypothetical protein n=1 Tax=Ruegeria sp. R14_0 TaxID=2821100 RepID=UPI001ADC8AFF|nr:hypothetical protein [Ruegeria sp. R14_0]MBO9447223.1 hypothetical protein [Ruegeria sp. R14_0]
MATTEIFEREINGKLYKVWVTDGFIQYVIDGEIRHDIENVSQFLAEAAKAINKPNAQDDTVVESNGTISDNALENFQNGQVAYDTGGTSPSINLQDDGTEVKIGGSGVGGSFRVDFGTGANAQAEAAEFKEFAEDLLGKATATELEQVSGVQIGDYLRTITVSQRDDDIQKIKFKPTGEKKDLKWADAFVDQLGEQFGGTKTKDGNVGEGSTTLNPAQVKISVDGLSVDLGSQGVGGKEVWAFTDPQDAIDFRDAVLEALGPGGDRSGILDEVIENLAMDMGGDILKDGKVSQNYTASQIKLIGADKNIVDLGSKGVGGKERYEFEDQAAALKFIDAVRDLVGVEAHEGPIQDEFIYKVSGGAGISGSPTFVGKDAFIEFIGDEFDGTLKKDGAVSESYSGGARVTKVNEDGAEVTLGPKGVGGKEVWHFEDSEDAFAFVETVNDFFG